MSCQYTAGFEKKFNSPMQVSENQNTTMDAAMDDRRLGQDGYNVNDVVITLINVPGQSRLKASLPDVMINLNTDDILRHNISQRMMLGTLQLSEAVSDILLEWKSRAPEQATIITLINVLSGAKLNDFANALATRFGILT